ncbi:tyrosine-type recombinase/integrase [Bacteroides fragilis]|nr:tyrosine-type recombinase/integrase [Bacteroides fragilis]
MFFPGEICYRRHKTNQLMRVGINREISRILERYKNVPGEYVFPLFPAGRDPYTGYRSAYHRIRYSLGKISRVIGLEFPLRLHAARHSWATIAKVNGAPVHVIGECLGHTSEKTTRIYLKELDHSALDAVNNQVADFILTVNDWPGPDRERYQFLFFISRPDDGRRLITPKVVLTADKFTTPGCFCKSRPGACGGIYMQKRKHFY